MPTRDSTGWRRRPPNAFAPLAASYTRALAALIAWRTENVLATIGVGMLALWAFQLVL